MVENLKRGDKVVTSGGIVGTVEITKQPSSNRTINLNLDDILTVGAAS